MGRRVLYAREIKAMNTAERVVRAYQAFADSENWPEWARKNPNEASLFAYAQKLMETDGE
jgi:hypothetical protein